MDAAASPARLKVTEIFRSLQGESDLVGLPTVFVRLTGCPLRCAYCDTTYAFTGGQWMTLEAILGTVAGHRTRHVCVTGGEPLAQPNCLPLLTALCDAGHVVSLETSGALPLGGVDPRVIKVVDVKTPDSGESGRNRYSELATLGPRDQVKFVVCGRADYEWARDRALELGLAGRVALLFSPSFGQVEPRDLAEWLLADGIEARMQLQLHKLLWGNEAGR